MHARWARCCAPVVVPDFSSCSVALPEPGPIFTEDFESWPTTGSGIGTFPYPNGWTASVGADNSWNVDVFGGTPSSNTGPTGGANGSSVYLYTESSGGTFRTIGIDSPYFSSATYPATELSFELSRFGATIGTLEVKFDDGSGTFSTTLATFVGQDPCFCPDYTLETIALPSPLPSTYAIQFFYTSGSSFTGDLAIDDFTLVGI